MKSTKIAPNTIVVYDKKTQKVITEIPGGAEYITKHSVYNGDQETFLSENPEYTILDPFENNKSIETEEE
jgi:hypothetical protein